MSTAPLAFGDLAEAYQVHHSLYSAIRDEDLEQHIRDYTLYLDEEIAQHIILVAHSQGKMYANFAYERLELERPELAERMRIVSLATPDDHVSGYTLPGTEPYTLLREDAINLLNIVGSMPWNMNNGEEWLGCDIEGDWAVILLSSHTCDARTVGPRSHMMFLVALCRVENMSLLKRCSVPRTRRNSGIVVTLQR